MGFRHLLAVDPRLSCSGWALFDLATETLCGVGRLRCAADGRHLAQRIAGVQDNVARLLERIEMGAGAVLICESHTAVVDPSAAIKIEQVRGIFETLARSHQALVPGRVNSRTSQSELLGFRGRQAKRAVVKSAAVSLVSQVFESALENLGFAGSTENLSRNQDIVDALLIGHYAMRRIAHANGVGTSLEEVFDSSKSRRRSSRYGWGKGEANSFGWSQEEIERLAAKR